MSLIGQDDKETIIARFARHVSSGKVDFFTQVGFDLVIGRREGVYIWDLDGRRLVNLHSNGGVYNLGHHNPQVVAALKQALDELDIGNSHLISEHRALLAERLAAMSPGDLNRVIFGVGGGEAVDMALKLARGYTGRPGVIYAQKGYHGHTGLALAAGDEQYRQPFEPLAPDFHAVPFGDLEALAAAMNESTAAVILEPIPATAGIVIPPEDYLAGVRNLCDQHGAVMIIDEVQTGLGRCGEVWCIDAYDVIPDILVTGKGLSGGIYPMAATIYRDPLDAFMREHPFIHVSTFGGAEVGCYAAMTVLDILQAPEFLTHVRAMADLFAAGFAELRKKYPHLIAETRQRGLMMGIKFVNDSLGPLFSLAGLHHGILTVYANNDTSVNQILPPLIITEQQVDEVFASLDAMLAWLQEMVG